MGLDLVPAGFNPWALPMVVTSLVFLGVGLLVLGRERFSPTGWSFALLCVSGFLWMAGFSALYCSSDRGPGLFWTRVSYLGVPFIPSSILHFTVSLSERSSPGSPWVGLTWFLSGLFALSAWTTTWFFKGLYSYWWGFYPEFSLLGTLFIIYFFVVMSWVLFRFWTLTRRARPGTRQHDLGRGIMISYGVGTLGAVDFLPAYGWSLYPMGFLPVLGMLGLLVYFTWNYQLNPLRPSFTSHQVLSTMSEAILVCDRNGVIRMANPSCTTFLGNPGILEGSRVEDVLAKTSPGKPVEKLVSSDHLDDKLMMTDRKDSRRYLQLRKSPILDHNDRQIGFVYVFRDRTREAKLKREALRDSLTGLPERSLFRDRSRTAMKKIKQNREEVIELVMADLDNFKTINDEHGHPAGDEVLRSVAERWEDVLRPGDTVARWGGDEFTFLVEGIPESESDQLRRRLTGVLEDPVTHNGKELQVRASFGQVRVDAHRKFERILEWVDEALYSAKQQTGTSWSRYRPPGG